MGNTDSRLNKIEELNKELKKFKFKVLILEIMKENQELTIDELMEQYNLKISELEKEIKDKKTKFNKECIEAQIQDDLIRDGYY